MISLFPSCTTWRLRSYYVVRLWLVLLLEQLKAAKYGIQKPSTCRATLFCCYVWVDVSRFSPCVINLSRNKNVCCRLKKVVAKSRARVYFEQQILALLLVVHQTYNLSRNKFAHVARQRVLKGLPMILCFQLYYHWSVITWLDISTWTPWATSWRFLYRVFGLL